MLSESAIFKIIDNNDSYYVSSIWKKEPILIEIYISDLNTIWETKIRQNEVQKFCKSTGLSFEDYLKICRRALLENNQDHEYVFERLTNGELQFTWKTKLPNNIILTLGSITIKPKKINKVWCNDDIAKKLIDELISITQTLTADLKRCSQNKLSGFINKEEPNENVAQEEIYSKFALLLNAKKLRIKELEHQLRIKPIINIDVDKKDALNDLKKSSKVRKVNTANKSPKKTFKVNSKLSSIMKNSKSSPFKVNYESLDNEMGERSSSNTEDNADVENHSDSSLRSAKVESSDNTLTDSESDVEKPRNNKKSVKKKIINFDKTDFEPENNEKSFKNKSKSANKTEKIAKRRKVSNDSTEILPKVERRVKTRSISRSPTKRRNVFDSDEDSSQKQDCKKTASTSRKSQALYDDLNDIIGF